MLSQAFLVALFGIRKVRCTARRVFEGKHTRCQGKGTLKLKP